MSVDVVREQGTPKGSDSRRAVAEGFSETETLTAAMEAAVKSGPAARLA